MQQEFEFDGASHGARHTHRRRNLRLAWAGVSLLVALASIVLILQHQRREKNQDAVILAAAARYDMPAALVKAVVWQESRFDPNAQGRAGEIGLMQISKLAAQEWAESEHLASFEHRQLFDPGQNTLAGTWYLRKLLRRYAHTDQPLAYALADYNAGRSNVRRWIQGAGATQSEVFLNQIDFPTTRRYVLSVLRRYQRYARKLPPPALPLSSLDTQHSTPGDFLAGSLGRSRT
jgi:soluble lytic murein transglycosylase